MTTIHDDQVNYDATEEWEIVLETLKTRDEELIGDWKDELNNLLIFAGLFSAVVTAFTIESYKWLQQDPADTSNQLLARISTQLASFTVTPSQVNSTIPPLDVSATTSSSNASSVALSVNVLWVLSLTLSLLSAFFGITVQQWLRRLRLPPDLPVHRAIELRQLRYEGLQNWQVSGIVSLLPLLLQVAVVLFLVGLFVLLRSLSGVVTAVFATVAAIGMLAFLITSIIPLFAIHCPYKSPAVPTVLIVLQWLSYPLTLVLAMAGLCIVPILNTRPGESLLRSLHIYWTYMTYIYWPYRNLLSYVKSFGSYTFVDISRFWLLQEFQDIKEPRGNLRLEALTDALLSVSIGVFLRLANCLNELTLPQITNVAEHSITRTCRAFFSDVVVMRCTSLCSDLFPHHQHWLGLRHHFLLSKAMPNVWPEEDGCSVLGQALVRLYQVETALELRDPRWPAVLQKISAVRHTSCSSPMHCSMTAWLLFDAATRHDHVFSLDDTVRTVEYASQCLAHARSLQMEPPSQQHMATGLWLASSAAAVTVLSDHSPTTVVNGASLISQLAGILQDNGPQQSIRVLSNVRKEHPHLYFLVMVPQAVKAICKSLATLAARDCISCRGGSRVLRLTGSLREICDGRDEEDFLDALQYLDIFMERYEELRKAADLEYCMEAFVLAEQRAMHGPFSELRNARQPQIVTASAAGNLGHYDSRTRNETAEYYRSATACICYNC